SGTATLGVNAADVPFAWDNERPALVVDVPGFAINRHDVANAEFMEFIDAGGYRDSRWWTEEDWAWIQAERGTHPLFWELKDGAWFWRGMFDLLPLPASWPAYVSQAEASAYARWRGARLPTEAEFQRAAYGTPAGAERRFPWGEMEPTSAHGALDF